VLSEVARVFGSESAAQLLTLQPDDSYHFDLWQAIHWTLREAGLPEENIEHSELCTRCHNDRFFSYRATPLDQRHNYGQFVAVIMLT
jgi:copper oxidase (laccase) domain-containing protein